MQQRKTQPKGFKHKMMDRNMFCKLKVVVDFLRIVYLPNKSKKIHKKYAKRII